MTRHTVGLGWQRLYRLLLLLYPRTVRARFGQDMAECFADLLTRATNSGKRFAVSRMVVRTLRDLPRSVFSTYRGNPVRAAHRASISPLAPTKKGSHVETLIRDIRFALRGFRKRPGFAFLAVVSLALGVGANTTMFSTVNAVLWQPLNVPEPERLVRIYEHRGGFSNLSYPNFHDIREQTDVFSGMFLQSLQTFGLTTDGQSEVVHGEVVSANYFQVLGIDMAQGKFFTAPESEHAGAQPVVVLGHDLWTRSFGSDNNIIGRTVRLNDRTMTVVGIAPADFNGTKFGLGMDLWVPVKIWGQLSGWGEWTEQRGAGRLNAVARLADDVTIEQAQVGVSAVASRLATEFPDTNRDQDFRLLPEKTFIPDAADLPKLIGLLAIGASSLVLLVACANVASLLFARALARKREVGVRLALGASRGRLVRQFLTESVVLAVFGGILGAVFAYWTSDFIFLFAPSLPYRFAIDTAPDVRVLTFALAVSLTAAFAFGLLPALRASRSDATAVVKAGASDAGLNLQRGRMFNGVVVTMVALSFVTLFLSILFTRSLNNVRAMSPGFATTDRLLATFDVALGGQDRREGLAFYKQLTERANGLPGVHNAALVTIVPLGDRNSTSRVYADDQTYGLDDVGVPTWRSSVSAEYFATMGTPLLSGRTFDERDRADATRAVIINQVLSKQLWPNEDPLGRRLRFDRTGGGTTVQVVGVIGDGRYFNMGETPRPAMFYPIDQVPATLVTLVVHAGGRPLDLIAPLRAAARSIDPTIPMFDVKTIDVHLSSSMWMFRLGAGIGGALGLLALALAAGGLYGIMTFSVNQRVRELGIRIALGAQRGQVLSLVLRRGLILVGSGIVLGLAGSIGISKMLTNVLFGVSPNDPRTLMAVAVVLTGVALAASLLPARSATQADPVNVLRTE